MKAEISPEEYSQKRYEITKELLAASLHSIDIHESDPKTRDSMIFNCIQIAESALAELFDVDYQSGTPAEDRSIRKLSDILKGSKLKDD